MLENLLIYIVLGLTSIINIVIPISGSATVTPFLAILTTPHIAIGLASFFFFLSGIVRVYMFRKQIQIKYVKSLLPISLVAAIVGAFALVKINPQILLIIILIFTSYFLYKKLKDMFFQKEKKSTNKLTMHSIGFLSGFLQGTGLAGSDLRNSYLYSKKLSLAQVHGTTALVGATNFFVATIIRLSTNQLTIPNLIPLLFVFPFIILGTWLGRKILYRIDKKYTNLIIILVMILIVLFLFFKIINQ